MNFLTDFLDLLVTLALDFFQDVGLSLLLGLIVLID